MIHFIPSFRKSLPNFILHMSNKKVNHYVKKELEIAISSSFLEK